ncbi:MAG TPA: type III-B CRISPR-associated protein Cas10/Cmr2, partial [Chloroflexota bacterium]|nr:type III-B CRISPR-associated protein Cas10/Cmr2 [Chloroflexota bacterium]
MSFLLAISLGPVQEFIAAARKTRDLWYGSALLADLARSAARALADGGAELIFPDLTAGGDSAPVANKLLAIVPDAPAERAAHARRAAEARLLAARDDALTVARERGLMPLLDRSLLDQQLDGFLEWFAAWWPYNPAGPDSYPEARRQVEALLAGRKAVRDFVPAA